MRRRSRWVVGLSLVALVVAGCGSNQTTYPFEPSKDPALAGMKEGMMKSLQSKNHRSPVKAPAGR